MNFFNQLAGVGQGGLDVVLHIKEKNGKLTVSVMPSGASKITPLLLTGTPEELDNGFFDQLAIVPTTVFTSNASQVKKEPTATKKEDSNSDKTEDKKTPPAKKAAKEGSKTAPKKAAKPAKAKLEKKASPAKKAKAVAPVSSIPDIFSQPPAAASTEDEKTDEEIDAELSKETFASQQSE